jgi:hypothetical protein
MMRHSPLMPLCVRAQAREQLAVGVSAEQRGSFFELWAFVREPRRTKRVSVRSVGISANRLRRPGSREQPAHGRQRAHHALRPQYRRLRHLVREVALGNAPHVTGRVVFDDPEHRFRYYVIVNVETISRQTSFTAKSPSRCVSLHCLR